MRQTPHLLRSLIVLVLIVIALPLATRPVSGQTNPVASLDPTQGLVQYRPAAAAETDWQTLTTVQLVEEGDWVRTDSLGLADLTFFEGVQSQILPNSQLQIGQFQADSTTNAFQVTLNVAVGDMHNQINQALGPNSKYEVNTPSAVIAVRGTDYWVSASWLSEALVNTLTGQVQVTGVLPDGSLGPSVLVGPDQSVTAMSTGNLSAIGPTHDIPQLPPSAPLAPATCGDAICQPGEETVCPVDCQTFASCGNQTCELDQGENPVTCSQDCVPAFRSNVQTTTTGATGQPCTIQTTSSSVPMRVGPGFNRGVRDYLPPNQPFPVLGDATASDGSLWWQIQVTNVPQAWVLQSDVTATGDCNVAAVPAPPIVLPPPPATNTPAPNQPPPAANPAVPMSVSFYADPATINYGACTTIHWDVEGIQAVYYEGQGVTGHETRQECPPEDQTYTLKVITKDNQTLTYLVTVTVAYAG